MDTYSSKPSYINRLAEPFIGSLLDELAAVLVVGPRAIGKTTTAKRYAKSQLLLDQPDTALGVRNNPDFALKGHAEPLLLDEWQVVPEVLGALKRSVDTDYRPGKFIVTGSVRGDLDSPNWPGTGRLIRVPMYGLNISEKIGAIRPRYLKDVVENGPDQSTELTISDYINHALSGGFPEVPNRSPTARDAFLDSYLDQVFTRDAATNNPVLLRRYFETLAVNLAGIPTESTLLTAAGINRKTAQRYDQTLRQLFLVEHLPAWSSDRLKRLVSRPKRFITDPALSAAILRLNPTSLATAGDMLGRIIEAAVYNEIRSRLPFDPDRPRLYHLRTNDGQEVDLIVEYGGGASIIGVEVKASSTVTPADAKHLLWLEKRLGDQFTGGVVFHTGPYGFQLAPKILALPIAALWAEQTHPA